MGGKIIFECFCVNSQNVYITFCIKISRGNKIMQENKVSLRKAIFFARECECSVSKCKGFLGETIVLQEKAIVL